MSNYLGKESLKAINDIYLAKSKPNDIANPVYFRFANGGSAIAIQSSSSEKERSITFSDINGGGNNFSIGCFGESSKAGDAYYPCIRHSTYGVQYIATEKWVRDNFGSTKATTITTSELKNLHGGGGNK